MRALARKIPDIAVNTAEKAVRTKSRDYFLVVDDTESATGSRHGRCCGFPHFASESEVDRTLAACCGTTWASHPGGVDGQLLPRMPLAGTMRSKA